MSQKKYIPTYLVCMNVDFFPFGENVFYATFYAYQLSTKKNITRVLVETEPALVFFISIEEVVLTQALCT